MCGIIVIWSLRVWNHKWLVKNDEKWDGHTIWLRFQFRVPSNWLVVWFMVIKAMTFGILRDHQIGARSNCTALNEEVLAEGEEKSHKTRFDHEHFPYPAPATAFYVNIKNVDSYSPFWCLNIANFCDHQIIPYILWSFHGAPVLLSYGVYKRKRKELVCDYVRHGLFGYCQRGCWIAAILFR